MSDKISKNADQIIQAGLAAARNASIENTTTASNRAVEKAVGTLSLAEDRIGEANLVSPLVEIAQLYVKDKIAYERSLDHGTKKSGRKTAA